MFTRTLSLEEKKCSVRAPVLSVVNRKKSLSVHVWRERHATEGGPTSGGPRKQREPDRDTSTVR